MGSPAFTLLTSILLCASSSAQEARPQPKRGGPDRNRLEVKDPRGFTKEGEQAVFSGPQPGEKLAAFQATGVDGRGADPVALAGGKPQILIFTSTDGGGVRGVYAFAGLASQVEDRAKADLHTSVVFLGDDRGAVSKFVARVAPNLAPRVDFMGGSPDGRDGPGNYGLNRNVAATILFARGGVVARSFVFPQGMTTPDPHVLGALAEVLGVPYEKMAEWVDAGDARGGPQMKRAGPSSPRAALGARLKMLVEDGTLTREQADELDKAAFPDEAPGGGPRPENR